MSLHHSTSSQANKDIRLIRMPEVRKMTGLSRSYVYSLSADGLFPKSVSLVPGGSSRAWVYSEVQDWLNGRVTERNLESV